MFCQSLKWVLWGAVCAAMVGCGGGGGLVPAKGKVTYKGQPVAGATVTFMPPGGTPGIGVTDAKGEYAINTLGRPGTTVGKHGVGITKYASSGDNPNMKPEDMVKMIRPGGKMDMPAPKAELPTKYAAPQTSSLQADVTADKSKNVFNFDLVD